MISFPRLVRRGDLALRNVLVRRATARGWTPAVLAYPGYGSGARARVLGRVLLAPPGTDPAARRAVPGWQRLLTLESAGTVVRLELAGHRHEVTSDADGLIDVTVDLPEHADVGRLTAHFSVGSRTATAPVHLASPGTARGVVCDIDDTVLVTGIGSPLSAAWRTFVEPMGRRAAVPGMAALLRELTAGDPHVPVVYLSNGPWNLAGPLTRFLARTGMPPGALLLTDWGPRPDRFFRSGTEHKRTELGRLAADLPGIRWTLVGDTGEHDPELYEQFAARQPDRVAAVLLRSVTGERRTSRVGGVPVVRAPDGAALAAALPALG